MNDKTVTNLDRALARFSVKCLVCSRARHKQRGFAFWLVKTVERHLCPFCRAYERDYGRKSHEPVPEPDEVKPEAVTPQGGAD